MTTRRIEIWSGEGNGPGTREEYTGKRTARALRARLTRERVQGERWARAVWADTQEPIGDESNVEEV